MRYSQTLIPTVKEVPAEAEIPSHQLMIRAGFIRKVASGTYTYLPLGYKSLLKIIAIIRDEMNAAAPQEILMPILQPLELWQQTGRDKDYGPTMCKFEDRHGRWNALAPTAEEVVTSLVAGEISSYKQLPVNLYQINTKFRDEFRPRFGVLRSREFIMKDAYSFHTSIESLDETYQKMYDAYCRIFSRCGLKFAPVEAESGPIGGSASHEFMVTCSAGEDVILVSDKGGYAANVEKCETRRPAPTEFTWDTYGLQRTGSLEEVATPGCSTVEDVAACFGTKPHFILKSILLSVDFEETRKPLTPYDTLIRSVRYILAVVRGDHEVNVNKVRHLVDRSYEPNYGLRVLHLDLADQAVATEAGLPIGYIGPHIVNGRHDIAVVLDIDVLPKTKDGR